MVIVNHVDVGVARYIYKTNSTSLGKVYRLHHKYLLSQQNIFNLTSNQLPVTSTNKIPVMLENFFLCTYDQPRDLKGYLLGFLDKLLTPNVVTSTPIRKLVLKMMI